MEERILIVDDDITFALMLRTWLSKRGFGVGTASSVAAARTALEAGGFSLVLSDMRLPDEDGIALLQWMAGAGVAAPVIVMTSYAEIQNAVRCMKLGARDYVAKPVNPDELLKKIREALDVPAAPAAKSASKPAPRAAGSFSEQPLNYIEGRSDAARQLYEHIRLVAPTNMSVLVNGASGTGKEHVAQLIHRESKRAGKPFVAVDCGAIPRDLAASEFFGHVKGAFTGALADKTGAFEAADGGTLFLDEVGNLGYETQVQLLRALQEREIMRVGGGITGGAAGRGSAAALGRQRLLPLLQLLFGDVVLGQRGDLAVKLGDDGKIVDLAVDYCAPEDYLVGMSMFIMRRDKLIQVIREMVPHGKYHLERDFILPEYNAGNLKVNVYPFHNVALFNQSVDEYFVNNMKLLEPDVRRSLFRSEIPIYTKVRDAVPTLFGYHGQAANCLIADGCHLFGKAENSVIFREVDIEEGAEVRDSIVMQGSRIGAGASIRYCILDKNVTIRPGTKLLGSKDHPLVVDKGDTV